MIHLNESKKYNLIVYILNESTNYMNITNYTLLKTTKQIFMKLWHADSNLCFTYYMKF